MEPVNNPDPLETLLDKIGVKLDKKPDVHPITQALAGGVGGIAGGALGGLAGLGPIGKAFAGLAGGIIAHIAVSYDVRLVKPGSQRDGADSPMSYSDRR